MRKVLFLDGKEREELISSINNQLEIKNRLLGLIMSNPDPKTSKLESSKKAVKYENQIFLLQAMLNLCLTAKTREDIKKLNCLIEQYKAVD